MQNDTTMVLERAWISPFRTKSDFAREYAVAVAAAASIGLITTQTERNLYGCTWRITSDGLSELYDHLDLH